MATLATMPPITISQSALQQFGRAWINNGQRLSRTPPESSGELGKLFDMAVGRALANLLGGIPIVSPSASSLTPPQADCVEVVEYELLEECAHKTSMLDTGQMEYALLLIAKHSMTGKASGKTGKT